MIEYGILTSWGLSSIQSELLPYFLFGGPVIVVIGYWAKKMMGAFIALLSLIFAYLYFAG